MRRTILLALLPAILLAACSQEKGTVYSVAPDKARQILSKTDLPPVFGSAAPSVQVQASKPGEVTWIVSRNGQELMRYIATLSEAGKDRTRVALELKGSKGPAKDFEKRMAENASIKNLYLVAMEERIASSIQGRPLDMTKIYPALMVASIANMPNIRKSVDEAAKASEALERNIRGSPAKPGRSNSTSRKHRGNAFRPLMFSRRAQMRIFVLCCSRPCRWRAARRFPGRAMSTSCRLPARTRS